jgi:hypothetical protein
LIIVSLFLLAYHNKLILLWRVASLMPNPKYGEPPLVSHPWLLIQNICSYPPYLETVSSIHNMRTYHASGKGPTQATGLHATIFCHLIQHFSL